MRSARIRCIQTRHIPISTDFGRAPNIVIKRTTRSRAHTTHHKQSCEWRWTRDWVIRNRCISHNAKRLPRAPRHSGRYPDPTHIGMSCSTETRHMQTTATTGTIYPKSYHNTPTKNQASNEKDANGGEHTLAVHHNGGSEESPPCVQPHEWSLHMACRRRFEQPNPLLYVTRINRKKISKFEAGAERAM